MRPRPTASTPRPLGVRRAARSACAGLVVAGLALGVSACSSAPVPAPRQAVGRQDLIAGNPTGSPITMSVLSSGVEHPGSIVAVPGAARSAYVVAGTDKAAIVSVASHGTHPFGPKPVGSCGPTALDERSGQLYAAQSCGNGGNISKVTATQTRSVVSGLSAPTALAVGPDGAYYVAESGAVVRIAGGKRTSVAVPGLLPSPSQDGTLLRDGRYAVLNNDRLFLVDFANGGLTTIAPPSGTSFQASGHAVMPDGKLRIALDDSPDNDTILGPGYGVVLGDLDVANESWTIHQLIREGQPDRGRIYVRSLDYDPVTSCTYLTDSELDHQMDLAAQMVYVGC